MTQEEKNVLEVVCSYRRACQWFYMMTVGVRGSVRIKTAVVLGNRWRGLSSVYESSCKLERDIMNTLRDDTGNENHRGEVRRVRRRNK